MNREVAALVDHQNEATGGKLKAFSALETQERFMEQKHDTIGKDSQLNFEKASSIRMKAKDLPTDASCNIDMTVIRQPSAQVEVKEVLHNAA